MEKKQFVALLYMFWVVPMMYTLSNILLPQLWLFWFGICNILALVVFAIVFTTNTNPTTQKKKKNSILIIWGLLLLTTVIWGIAKYSDNASQRLYEKAIAPTNITWTTLTWNNTIATGTLWSWTSGTIVAIDLITGDININNLSGKTEPEYIKPTVSTGSNTDTFQTKDPEPVKTADSNITTVLPTKGTLSYAQVIPYLVSKYNLKNNGKSTNFTNISSTNSLYSTFNIAANKGMIWVNINPASKVSCNTYLVLKGIAGWWKVEYKSWDPFGPYRTAAYNKWEVNGCSAWAFVTKATL